MNKKQRQKYTDGTVADLIPWNIVVSGEPGMANEAEDSQYMRPNRRLIRAGVEEMRSRAVEWGRRG